MRRAKCVFKFHNLPNQDAATPFTVYSGGGGGPTTSNHKSYNNSSLISPRTFLNAIKREPQQESQEEPTTEQPQSSKNGVEHEPRLRLRSLSVFVERVAEAVVGEIGQGEGGFGSINRGTDQTR